MVLICNDFFYLPSMVTMYPTSFFCRFQCTLFGRNHQLFFARAIRQLLPQLKDSSPVFIYSMISRRLKAPEILSISGELTGIMTFSLSLIVMNRDLDIQFLHYYTEADTDNLIVCNWYFYSSVHLVGLSLNAKFFEMRVFHLVSCFRSISCFFHLRKRSMYLCSFHPF